MGPPTNGTLNSTVADSVSCDPSSEGASTAAPRPEPGAPATATLISPVTRPSLAGHHFSVLRTDRSPRYNLRSIVGNPAGRKSSVMDTVTVPSGSTINESRVLLPPKAAIRAIQ